jgi:hypothetical protein
VQFVATSPQHLQLASRDDERFADVDLVSAAYLG